MSQVKITTITAVLLITGLLFMGGCSSSSPNSKAAYDADSGHAEGWLPAGHMNAARADQTVCTECHGTNFLGGFSGVTCMGCHLGGPTVMHPQDWTGSRIWSKHAAYAGSGGTSACATIFCHGSALRGVQDSGPSCTSCHLGGEASAHPLDWDLLATTKHAAYVAGYGNTSCANAACHGTALSGVEGSGSSCSSCHLGGSSAIHPVDWGQSASIKHAAYVKSSGSAACANAACHGATLEGVTNSGASCSSCHLGGASSVHPQAWGGSVAAAHGAYVTANGNTSCANISCHGASLAGVADSGPSCTSCHVEVGSFHPSSWGQSADTLHGSYVDTNGTTACATAACHGTGLNGVANSGPSCASCHLGGASSVHPADWGANIDTLHGSFADVNGTTSCANAACHGAGLTGVTSSGPSCTSCHLGGVSAVHPADWGANIDTVHSAYVTTNGNTSCANTACHGSSLAGKTDSGPSCSSCHLGGSGSIHPQTWGLNIDTAHGSYVDTNGNMSCSNISCHGATLSGVTNSGPSCSNCHIGGVGSFHPQDWAQNATIMHGAYVGTNGTTACANAACHGATLAGVTNSGPACSSCHLSVSGGAPQPSTGCTSCHGNPPSGSSSPDRAGSHGAHNALTNVTGVCNTCHNGYGSATLSHNTGTAGVSMLSGYNAKSGGSAVPNGNGTCSNVSCHGGQTTPVWLSGTLDVSTQCASCHSYGTTQYNSYYSGAHYAHVYQQGLFCTDCHDTVKLAVNHFTALNTATMEGPAPATLNSSLQYDGTCTSVCHSKTNW